MTDREETKVRGLRDGGAEVAVVLTLGWDDVAALGREASRLAEQRGTPVTLDEAASHRLRTWSSVAAGPEARGRAVGPAPAAAPDRPRPHTAPLGDAAPVTPLSPHTAQRAPGRPAAAAGGANPA